MGQSSVDRAVEVMKLDLYDHAQGMIEGLEALQLLARAASSLALETEVSRIHSLMVRLSASISKLRLEAPTTHDEYKIEVVEE